MSTVHFNGKTEEIDSIDTLSRALDRFDGFARFELWLSLKDGPRLCMLRNEEFAFLMYLRSSEDPGLVSTGEANSSAAIEYTLSNGQVDEYPQSWCIPIENCYKAVAYFFVNEGLRPKFVQWSEQ